MYHDKSINKYVKTHPEDNIHKRNPSAIKAQGMNCGLIADTHPYLPFQDINGTS